VTTDMPPLALLAGGLATRMRPLTETVPKALLEVAGEPFVAHQLRLLAREGVRRVVLCVGYLGEQVAEFVGDGSRFGVEAAFVYDGPQLLGTGGALRRALPAIGSDEFLVMYGDSYLDVPFAPVVEAFRRSGRSALMTVFRNEGRWDTSNAVYAEDRVVFYSKTEKRPDMAYIDWGLGIVRSKTLEAEPAGVAFDLARVYTTLAAAGDLAGYEVQQRFYEIGSHTGLTETHDYLSQPAGTAPAVPGLL
jgi:NDP-sugar pyrophosphorylase family protein